MNRDDYQSVDEKGRVIIPRKHRKGTSWMFVRLVHRLFLFTEKDWKAHYERLSARAQRAFSACSFQASMDKAGRICIPSNLRERFGLYPGGEVIVAKENGFFRIRSLKDWQGRVPCDEITLGEYQELGGRGFTLQIDGDRKEVTIEKDR